MYKLLLLDLDGTLLDDYKRIPEKNMRAIKNLHDDFGITPVIGINAITVLTSAILGFPGVCLLFGISFL